MTFDCLTAGYDRTSVGCPQRNAPRTAESALGAHRRWLRRDRTGTARAATRMQGSGAGPERLQPLEPAFRSPIFHSNDSAGSDDGAVAGLEGAQTWASR
ncbi:hypothetical protein GCM10007067_23060 [Lysobacter bugurensis]|uniref:Uncharacterized protein n=1 Tax=Cognatilysobacter bugurensis TaxID=543356 RepID=A0A918W9E6_9GAMM|nr:hypothetical protein GCM10007067_23060 [Lysobacter bugurensis]